MSKVPFYFCIFIFLLLQTHSHKNESIKEDRITVPEQQIKTHESRIHASYYIKS